MKLINLIIGGLSSSLASATGVVSISYLSGNDNIPTAVTPTTTSTTETRTQTTVSSSSSSSTTEAERMKELDEKWAKFDRCFTSLTKLNSCKKLLPTWFKLPE
ncbi:hypothetical protein OVS_04165 [Mycoplasma ovis str. Michigan]|uniref:Uncharacterized protein n=1 Tax=Mycoplasma ovis str. Michigan TaxID=1415773 RepID=A0ABM5P266_9MOLU|nr:hypothetical protein [Mycoplasma ovis]AHC40560.1 hypothetical protein OVS_04165 [Mycoplasma ovis str. Michigan]